MANETREAEKAKLLPCPWCEREARMIYLSGNWKCECAFCLACGPFAKTQREAEEKWNTRSPQPAAKDAEAIAENITHSVLDKLMDDYYIARRYGGNGGKEEGGQLPSLTVIYEIFKPIIASHISALCAERDAAVKVIEKLPKTADGVPIYPGMTVWVPSFGKEAVDDMECLITGVTNYNACGCDGDGEESFHTAADDCRPDCDKNTKASLAYSTREAAIAASSHGTKEGT